MSARTDVILPITNEYMQQITSGNKNYDFRRVYIAFSVCRVWFYLTAPHSEIGYISEISPARTRHHPGDQPLVEDGLGNRQFNQGSATRDGVNYAYRLRSVYKLKSPVGLKDLRERYGLKGPPRGLVYVPSILARDVVWNEQIRLLPVEYGTECRNPVVAVTRRPAQQQPCHGPSRKRDHSQSDGELTGPKKQVRICRPAL
jgi:predicted transcriptional regulator